MIIFDKFKTALSAHRFAKRFRGTVCNTYAEVDQLDCFPFELAFPVVMVKRDTEGNERVIERAARHYGGRFAGT